MKTHMNADLGALHEKTSAAASSVVAAIALTGFKLAIGLLTNSLGILAEAAHSGLDLLAAVMTLFAVRVAGKPADEDHPFGHGKIENISALGETILLFMTSGWIIYEAIHRLTTGAVEMEVSIWGFIVMGTSIAIDAGRSRVLMNAAKKHNSLALEADALHFSTDIWSSSVVILGLALVWASQQWPAAAFLSRGDSIAALIVALIVIFVAGEMGMRSIHALLDTAPANGEDRRIIEEVIKVPGVHDVHAVRIRASGAHWFVDLHMTMDGQTTLKESHDVTESVERVVHSILPRADVTVHVEPLEHAQS